MIDKIQPDPQVSGLHEMEAILPDWSAGHKQLEQSGILNLSASKIEELQSGVKQRLMQALSHIRDVEPTFENYNRLTAAYNSVFIDDENLVRLVCEKRVSARPPEHPINGLTEQMRPEDFKNLLSNDNPLKLDTGKFCIEVCDEEHPYHEPKGFAIYHYPHDTDGSRKSFERYIRSYHFPSGKLKPTGPAKRDVEQFYKDLGNGNMVYTQELVSPQMEVSTALALAFLNRLQFIEEERGKQFEYLFAKVLRQVRIPSGDKDSMHMNHRGNVNAQDTVTKVGMAYKADIMQERILDLPTDMVSQYNLRRMPGGAPQGRAKVQAELWFGLFIGKMDDVRNSMGSLRISTAAAKS